MNIYYSKENAILIDTNIEAIKQARAKCKEDAKLSRQYTSKIQNAKDRKIDFLLSFNEYRKLMKTKRCYFTGLKLCELTMSLDRVNNVYGYVSGNVVACHTNFNALKGTIENPNNSLTLSNCLKGLTKWNNTNN
tara:strand:+ start:251 stop:652 length:402 start_codon:yes stop_codon:yes gene_type:complete